MQTWVAFLRGINVGGNTMVSMKELAAICTHMGFLDVQTYLNSGNIIFKSPLPEAELQKALEQELSEKTGKDIRVVIRSSGDLEQMIDCNPFPEAVPSQIGVSLEQRWYRKKSWRNSARRAGRRSCPGNGKCIFTTRTAWAAQN